MSRVPNDLLICNDCQGGACRVVSRKVPDECWVPNDPLVPKDKADSVARCQGRYLTTP